MVSKFINKKGFYFNFFEKQEVPLFYQEITYKNKILPLQECSRELVIDQKKNVNCIELFPTYFIPKIENPDGFNFKRIFRVKGHCIDINNFDNIDSYLQANFKPNARTSLRRRIKGLESSFNISYKLFYGQISRVDYELLMQSLHDMIVRRFNQRDDDHESLKRWEGYYKSVYTLINESKASLYVIYDDTKPIQISLNYHHDKIVFLAIPAYDIDYAKFGLGNITVHKLLEWCINNKYVIFDMGYGAFDYKLKWCNHNYDFEHHLFYKKGSIIAEILIRFITLKTQLINFLIKKGVNQKFHKLRTFLRKKPEIHVKDYFIEASKDTSNEYQDTKLIDFNHDPGYCFLKKPVYDFLYTHLEHISKVEVYEMDVNKVYLIKGQKSQQRITF